MLQTVLQSIAAALLVLGCSLYAAWTLMPSAARRVLAMALLRWPLPEVLAARLRQSAQAASGCGCDGCDRAAPKPPAASVQKITFHPRAPR
ncbi:MAG: hypothetical protein H7337_21715 [Rhizobacter sp.]|nr:hypothetical protein [Rhizobacter sp.]